MILFLLFWFAFCFCVGLFAQYRRNRDGGIWFMLAFLISPLLAGIIVAILPSLDAAVIPVDAVAATRAYHPPPSTMKDVVQIAAVVIAALIVVVFLAQLPG